MEVGRRGHYVCSCLVKECTDGQSPRRLNLSQSRQLSRRLLVEDRRARRMQDLMCSVNEAKPFRFTGPLSYRF